MVYGAPRRITTGQDECFFPARHDMMSIGEEEAMVMVMVIAKAKAINDARGKQCRYDDHDEGGR